MAKAKKLPSGSWRCQVFDYTDSTGKNHYKSFTAPTKKAAELMAAQFMADKDSLKQSLDITVAQAVKSYIDSKEAVLSPSTIRGYLHDYENHVKSSNLGSTELLKVTNARLQVWVSEISQKGLSAKTVGNKYGLVVAALGMFHPDFRPRVTLPKVDPTKRYTPSDEDVKKVIAAIENEELLAMVLLYAFGPMRRGEICALEDTDIHGTSVSVTKSLVRTPEHTWVIKPPKTMSSIRTLAFPEFVIVKLPKKKGRLFTQRPDALTHQFTRLVDSLGLPHFTLHDLRHYSASIMHALNVPDKYIMARGGWKTDRVMKSVYQNIIDAEAVKQQQVILSHFEEISHEISHGH